MGADLLVSCRLTTVHNNWLDTLRRWGAWAWACLDGWGVNRRQRARTQRHRLGDASSSEKAPANELPDSEEIDDLRIMLDPAKLDVAATAALALVKIGKPARTAAAQLFLGGRPELAEYYEERRAAAAGEPPPGLRIGHSFPLDGPRVTPRHGRAVHLLCLLPRRSQSRVALVLGEGSRCAWRRRGCACSAHGRDAGHQARNDMARSCSQQGASCNREACLLCRHGAGCSSFSCAR